MSNMPGMQTSMFSSQRYKVAVVQAAPVAFDLQPNLQTAQALVAEAAARGAQVVLFPEAFLSPYPHRHVRQRHPVLLGADGRRTGVVACNRSPHRS